MTLAERLSSPPVNPASQYCTVGKLLQELDPLTDHPVEEEYDRRDYTALVEALSSKAWQATDLASALLEEGREIDVRHLREHRRGSHSLKNCAVPDVGILS